MREVLVPRGDAPLVNLRPYMGMFFVDKELVDAAIDELEKIPVRAALGEPPNPLEKLAFHLLQSATRAWL
jgi:hypothetical protein